MKYAWLIISFFAFTSAGFAKGRCELLALDPNWSKARFRLLNSKPDEKGRSIARITGNALDKTGRRRISNAHVLTPQELQAAFKIVQEMDIAYYYPEEGCYARAHLMAKKLEEQGIVTAKAFALGHEKPYLLLRIKNPYNNRYQHWAFHVAPLVMVALPGAEEPAPMILDPSLHHEPLTLESWLAKMQFKERDNPTNVRVKLLITDRFEYQPPALFRFNRDDKPIRKDWDRTDLDIAEHQNNGFKKWIRSRREPIWKRIQRLPAQEPESIREIEKMVVADAFEEKENFWVVFENKAAYYFIPKSNTDWQEMKTHIKRSRQNQLPISVKWDLDTLEIHSITE